MKKRRYFCLAAVVMLMCLPCLCASAQTDRKEVRSGNRDFRKVLLLSITFNTILSYITFDTKQT